MESALSPKRIVKLQEESHNHLYSTNQLNTHMICDYKYLCNICSFNPIHLEYCHFHL